jgi:uncharacterized protein (TIGR03790 family)
MRKFVALLLGWCGIASLAAAPLGPNEVVVVFNSAVPDSVKLAAIYREARKIPEGNMIGLKMPAAPDISRAEYVSAIQNPLRREFDKRGFWKRGKDSGALTIPVANKIRVLLTLRGVPLRIKPEPKPKGFKEDPKNPVADRDEAAVDSELALFGVEGLPLKGLSDNKYFKSEKSITEARFPFMVLTARIDAPSLATCERMIHDAIDTEASGLFGRAYVDLANKYPQGEKWLQTIVVENLRVGIPTVVDRFTDTLPKNYPMTDAALYYGWYDWNLSGPFMNSKFRFRKGAVALHLHSYSGQQLTDPTQNWSAGLLEKGAAATIGNVYEPYLHFTHWFDILHQRLLAGFTFVEAAWMSVPVTSWQAVALGDPLYRPFLHFDGSGQRLKLDSEFLAVRLAAMRWGDSPEEMLKQLKEASERMKSGVIAEAVGLRLLENTKTIEAAEWFRNAKDYYGKTEDKLRQDFNLISLHRASPTGKAQAVQALREAKSRYGLIPEAAALAGWLDILDPPPPPPADPTKPPPAKPPPAAATPAKATPPSKTPPKSNRR